MSMNALNERKFVWFWFTKMRNDPRRARRIARRMKRHIERFGDKSGANMYEVYKDVARNCDKQRYVRVRMLSKSGKTSAMGIVLRKNFNYHSMVMANIPPRQEASWA